LEIDTIPVVYANNKQWIEIPLSGKIESFANMTYDERVRAIIMKSVEEQLDKYEEETN
jgi:hypothetical protein